MAIKEVINTSLEDKLRELDDRVEEDKKEELMAFSKSLTDYCAGFTDTGAFVTSFSFAVGAGRPRGKSSHGLPRRQDKEAKADEGYQNLVEDLKKADLKGTTSTIVLRNNAPHADYVDAKHGVLTYIGARIA